MTNKRKSLIAGAFLALFGLAFQINNSATSLPSGLSFASPTLTISSATNGNAVLALSGNTSGTATLTAPAVAGVATNPITISNGISIPAGTNAAPSLSMTADPTSGLLDVGSSQLGVQGTSNINFYGGAGRTLFWQMNGTAGNFALTNGKGQHINTSAANNDLFGTASGTTTTATVAFTTNYTSTPVCVITPTTAGVTSAIITAQANTGFTITYAPSGSTTFNYHCGGNPN